MLQPNAISFVSPDMKTLLSRIKIKQEMPDYVVGKKLTQLKTALRLSEVRVFIEFKEITEDFITQNKL